MFICDKDEHCIDCPKNYPNEQCEHWVEVDYVKHGHWQFKDDFGNRDYDFIAVCSRCGNKKMQVDIHIANGDQSGGIVMRVERRWMDEVSE